MSPAPSTPYKTWRSDGTMLRGTVLEPVSQCPFYDPNSAVSILLDILAFCCAGFLRAKALSCGQ